jgi:hypothetical protein
MSQTNEDRHPHSMTAADEVARIESLVSRWKTAERLFFAMDKRRRPKNPGPRHSADEQSLLDERLDIASGAHERLCKAVTGFAGPAPCCLILPDRTVVAIVDDPHSYFNDNWGQHRLAGLGFRDAAGDGPRSGGRNSSRRGGKDHCPPISRGCNGLGGPGGEGLKTAAFRQPGRRDREPQCVERRPSFRTGYGDAIQGNEGRPSFPWIASSLRSSQ